jgi:hypothetical protein
MNTRILASIAVIALLLIPAAAIHTAKAQTTPSLQVSAQYINYNIVLLKIKGVPSSAPPAVLATLYDANGNVLGNTESSPYILVAGYVGNNEWDVYIALNKTFTSKVFTATYMSNASTKIGLSNGQYLPVTDLGEVTLYSGVNLASPTPLYRLFQYLAVNGELATNITNITVVGTSNFATLTAAEAWPVVNALPTSIGGTPVASIKITVYANGGEASTTLTVGSAGFVSTTSTYLNMAPEKTVYATISAPTLAVDPTTANSLTYTECTPIVLATNRQKTATIFNSSEASPAIKAAVLEGGSSGITLNATITNTTTSAAFNLTAKGLAADTALFVKVTVKGNYTLNGQSTVFENTTYVLITSSDSNIEVFNWTGLNLVNGTATFNITCAEITVVPAAVKVSINGYSNVEGNYTIALGTTKLVEYYSIEDYANIVSLAQSSSTSSFTASIYMPGRNDIPTYNAIKETYAVNGAPVVIEFTDTLGQTSDITGFIKLQNGEVIVPSVVKPGQTITLEVKDIDAAAAPVNITLIGVNGNVLAKKTIETSTVSEGIFKASISVVFGPVAITSSEPGQATISVDQNVAEIKFSYLDKYGAGGSEVLRTNTTMVEFWPVTVKAPNVTYIRARINLTIQSNNFNMEPNAREMISIKPVCCENYAEVFYNNVEVGKIYVSLFDVNTQKWNTTVIADNIAKIFAVHDFYETGPSTGAYPVYIYVYNIPGIKNGDKLNITYYDMINDKTITYIIPVEAIKGQIYILYNGQKIMLSNLPIAATTGGNVTREFTAVVNDADANTHPSEIDNVTVYLSIELQNGTKWSWPAKFTETDVDTGVFTAPFVVWYADGYFGITLGNVSVKMPWSLLPFATIGLDYYDHSVNTWVNYTIPIRPATTANLTITPTVVNSIADNITITLKDNDLNVIPGAGNDELPTGLEFQVYSPITKTITVGEIENTGYYFEEVQPGVFQVTLPVKAFAEVLGVSPYSLIGQKVVISYTDPATQGSVQGALVSMTTTASFSVKAHTAVVTVEPTKVSPYGTIYIKIYDPDLIGLTAADVLGQPSQPHLVVASSIGTIAKGTQGIDIIYPANGLPSENGTFVFAVHLSPSMVQLPSDVIVITYTDTMSANGQPTTIVKKVEVVTQLGQISVEPEPPQADHMLTIIVKDFDQNKDPYKRDIVKVQVWDNELPLRKTVVLVETGPNTGVFENTIRLTSNPAEAVQPNVVYAPAGSTLYIEYIDPISPNGTNVTVKASYQVVSTSMVSTPLTPMPQKAELINPQTLKPITTVQTGEQATIVLPVTNSASTPLTVYAVVTVYKAGTPVMFLVSGPYTIPASSTSNIAITLLPISQPGTYTVHIVLLKSLQTLTPLSKQPAVITITVQ